MILDTRKPFLTKKATRCLQLFLSLGVILLFTAGAQAGESAWNSPWNSCDSGRVAAFSRTSGGFVFLLNTACGLTRDVHLIRTDEDGNILWNRRLGSDDTCLGAALIPLANGNYAVCGSVSRAGGPDFWLAGTDSNGTILWRQVWGDSGSDGLNDLAEDSKGNLRIAGWTQREGRDDTEMYLAQTDPLGNVLWAQTFGGESSGRFSALCLGEIDAAVAIGQSAATSHHETDIEIVKVDRLGQTVWRHSYKMDESVRARDVAATPDGGYVFAASCVFGRSNEETVRVLKTDGLGSPLWSNRYLIQIENADHFMIRPDAQGYTIGAYSITADTVARELSIVHANRDGEELWKTRYSRDGFSNFCRNRYMGWYSDSADPLGEGLRVFFGEPLGILVLAAGEPRLMGIKRNKLVSRISMELPNAAPMKLSVSKLTGTYSEVLQDGHCAPGRQSTWWNATDKSNGIYIVRLDVGSEVRFKKIVVMK